MSIAQRLGLARQILVADTKSSSWDDALGDYLAVRAITTDESIDKLADWKSLLDKLGEYLSRDCFPAEILHHRSPSPYDSPSNFDPATWKQRFEPVVESLGRLESTTQ